MPRPKYILCCETRLIDKITGMVSHINVLESFAIYMQSSQIEAHERPKEVPEQANSLPLRMTVTALWWRSASDDPEQPFEHEVLVHRPGFSEPFAITCPDFTFSTEFFRHDVNVILGTPAKASGYVMIEARVRPKEGGEWVSQSYPISVTYAVVGEAPTTKSE